MNRQGCRVVLGIGVILLLMACSSVSPVFPPNVPRKRDCPQVTIVDVPADLDRPLEDVVLQAGDRVQVKVYSVDKSLVPGCSKTFTVPARGVLNYPYLSKLQLRGKKLGEFKSLLDKALRGRVVKNPSITLEVLDFAPRRVTLVGLFVAPGVYELNPLKRRSLVLEVLDNGRGLRYNAARHRMILRRQNPFHFSQTILNWCELVKPGAEPIVLQGGDRLEVQVVEPLRIIGAVNKPIIELKYPAKPIRIYELVQLAGGLARFADSEIEIRRQGRDGKWGTIKVDYDDILNNPLSEHNVELLPGDRVQVHETPY